jgi:hypothetical protein
MDFSEPDPQGARGVPPGWWSVVRCAASEAGLCSPSSAQSGRSRRDRPGLHTCLRPACSVALTDVRIASELRIRTMSQLKISRKATSSTAVRV